MIRSLLSVATGLSMAALMAAPVLGQADDPVALPAGEMDAAERDRIDAAIVDLLDRNPELPALYIGIWDPERGAYTAAYGTADLDSGRAASVEDHLRIGSISKTFTGAVVLQLVDEGLVELDATVEETAPELASRFPDVADRTVAQLLTMSSGIPDYANVPDGVVGGIAADPSRVWSADELVQIGIDGGLADPGTPGYSTTNYILLQEIAEDVTGTSLADLIAERLAGPLALEQTALPAADDVALPDPFARGYLTTACAEEIIEDGGTAAPGIEAGADVTEWSHSWGQGGGGMYSTVEDLGTWAASMAGSSLLSPELAQERLDRAVAVEGVGDYGLGIIDFGGIYGHEGEIFGWEGVFFQEPVGGVSAVVAGNSCAINDVLLEAYAILNPAAAGA